jgi:hypothetical protein
MATLTIGNVNRKLTICDNLILIITPQRVKYEDIYLKAYGSMTVHDVCRLPASGIGRRYQSDFVLTSGPLGKRIRDSLRGHFSS